MPHELSSSAAPQIVPLSHLENTALGKVSVENRVVSIPEWTELLLLSGEILVKMTL